MNSALINAAIVGSGGFVGAICRWGLHGLVQRVVGVTGFPWGTLVVNLTGCLLIGAAIGALDSRQLLAPEFRMFALIGVLGGFTTYSTFGYETFVLLRDADYLRAVASVSLHVVLGVALVAAGYSLAARWA